MRRGRRNRKKRRMRKEKKKKNPKKFCHSLLEQERKEEINERGMRRGRRNRRKRRMRKEEEKNQKSFVILYWFSSLEQPSFLWKRINNVKPSAREADIEHREEQETKRTELKEIKVNRKKIYICKLSGNKRKNIRKIKGKQKIR